MCGIAGIFNQKCQQPVQLDALQRSVETMRHRGPDAQRAKVLNCNTGFGHARLSILDLRPESHQPFEIDDGDYVITYNGEIFNYIELRDELKQLGHKFVTTSDTEVLIHAYKQWGEQAIPKLNGMWAFAIYDRKLDLLFCSRDRFGIKPFNYAPHNGRFLFGSEIKAILSLEPALARPNYHTLSLAIREGVSAQLLDTCFEGIKRVPPAHNMFVTRQGIEFKRYWDYPTDTLDLTHEKAVKGLRDLLTDAVKLRMRSDVPVGNTLSSGIDSSTLVCLLRTFYDGPHNTFTAAFPQDPWDEAPMAKQLAEELGMDANLIHGYEGDFLPLLRSVINHLETPIRSHAVLPLWNIMKLARTKVKVVIEGQGADEILAGYVESFIIPMFLMDLVSQRHFGRAYRELSAYVRAQPWRRSLFPIAKGLMPGWMRKMYRSMRGDESVYQGPLRDQPTDVPFRPDPPPFKQRLNRALHYQHEGKLVYLLHYGDAISMAHSIESRLPFMDYRIVEYCFRLAGDLKIRNGHGKVLLKDAARGIVPDHILEKTRKIGFATPIARWFRESPEQTIYPVLRSETCRQRGLFDSRRLQKMIEQHVSGKTDLSGMIYRWISTELWFQEFID